MGAMGRARRERLRYSSSIDSLASPTDSGYGSADGGSKENSPLARRGFRSPDEAELDEDICLENQNIDDQRSACSPVLPSLKGTPHSISRRYRFSLDIPAAFHSSPSRHYEAIRRFSRKRHVARCPDRFVPRRDDDSPIAEKFKTTKHPTTLSDSEKIARHNGVTPDAFCYQQHVESSVLPASSRPRARMPPTSSRTALATISPNQASNVRAPSHGTVWAVRGAAPAGMATEDGYGRLVQSGSTARLYTTLFPVIRAPPEIEQEKHEERLASALKIDRMRRILECDPFLPSTPNVTGSKTGQILCQHKTPRHKTTWNGSEWESHNSQKPPKRMPLELSSKPARVLEAPGLRDDFYCSVLSYSHTTGTLAVGLDGCLSTWTEEHGAKLLKDEPLSAAWITSIAFSSEDGRKSVLVCGYSDGQLCLISTKETQARFDVQHPYRVTCVSWRPKCTMRPSRNPLNPGPLVQTEDLLVADDIGNIYYYIVEWPEGWEVNRNNWPGTMTLVSRITAHTQQVCGLAWSPDGQMFASGGNDNLCCLFTVAQILHSSMPKPNPVARTPVDAGLWPATPDSPIWAGAGGGALGSLGRPMHSSNSPREIDTSRLPNLTERYRQLIARSNEFQRIQAQDEEQGVCVLPKGSAKHCWFHESAVKAIAFCPWRDGLVATGGGSNDKCIHFFHTLSGTALATISVSAQITSLVWSTTRKEIAATFGYTDPDHPYRIAIFSWPECQQVAVVPWEGDSRALYAIPYPRFPRRKHGRHGERAAKEGCIVVASSSEKLQFHDVWTSEKKPTVSRPGLFGGSEILEGLEGIDKEGDVIR